MSRRTSFLFFSTLLFVDLFVFVSADQKIITAESEQNVTLTCRAPNINVGAVKWTRADLNTKYVLLYRQSKFIPDDQHTSFTNRVVLQDSQMKDGDVSLILKDVTINDTGTYECQVIPRGGNNLMSISNITLSVDPPGQTRGDTEDGGKEAGGKEAGGHTEAVSVGLIVGLSVSAVLLVAAVVGFLIYRKHSCK